MKVIIPVIDNDHSKMRIAASFHNTEFACIYNCSNKNYEWVNTKKMSQNTGSLEMELMQNGITAVISNQMPLMALGFFTESGLTVFKAVSEDIEENIKLFISNQLTQITNTTAKSASSCSGACGSCNTICKS